MAGYATLYKSADSSRRLSKVRKGKLGITCKHMCGLVNLSAEEASKIFKILRGKIHKTERNYDYEKFKSHMERYITAHYALMPVCKSAPSYFKRDEKIHFKEEKDR
jgi:hypothetical protein